MSSVYTAICQLCSEKKLSQFAKRYNTPVLRPSIRKKGRFKKEKKKPQEEPMTISSTEKYQACRPLSISNKSRAMHTWKITNSSSSVASIMAIAVNIFLNYLFFFL